MNKVRRRSSTRTRTMTRVGMLSVIAFVLMFFQLPLTFVAPPFIKLDVAELPVLLGAFTMGPIAGVVIAFLKNILAIIFKGTTTGYVGELSNFILSATFAVVSSAIYRRNKTYKNAMVGLTLGTVAFTIMSLISNYYVIFPLYSHFMPMEAIINAGKMITPRINNLFTMMIYSILPFNLIKGFTVSAVMMFIYKKVSPILKDEN